MNRVYNADYYEDVIKSGNGISYSEKEKWYPFFENIANRLIENYQPKTVLDVGCAYGYLVEVLRKKGIEAYGIDISEHAVNSVDESIRSYVKVNSASEVLPSDFPKHFDVIISIEVLEHMTVEEGEKALKQLCQLTDTFVFSSSDSDLKDVTHINVQRKEYWARIFAKQGFFRDVQLPPAYISECADVYRRRNDIYNVIQEYEVILRIAKEQRLGRCLDSQIYYDLGEGFREENKFVIENAIMGERIQFAIDLPANVKSIRFDPTENLFCILSELAIRVDGELQGIDSTNGLINGELILFDTTDPQIMVCINNPGRLVITGEIHLSEDINMSVATLLGIKKKLEKDEKCSELFLEIKDSQEKLYTELRKRKNALERENKRLKWCR